MDMSYPSYLWKVPVRGAPAAGDLSSCGLSWIGRVWTGLCLAVVSETRQGGPALRELEKSICHNLICAIPCVWAAEMAGCRSEGKGSDVIDL